MEYHGAIDFVLYRNANNNTYTLFTADGTRYTYAGLKLSTIVSPDSPSNKLTFSYNVSPGYITQIQDGEGRTVSFSYNSNNTLASITVGLADLEVHVQGVRPLLGHRPAGQGHPVLLRVQPVANHRDSVPDGRGDLLHLRRWAGRAVRLDLRGLPASTSTARTTCTCSPGTTPTSSTWSTARWSRPRSSTTTPPAPSRARRCSTSGPSPASTSRRSPRRTRSGNVLGDGRDGLRPAGAREPDHPLLGHGGEAGVLGDAP